MLLARPLPFPPPPLYASVPLLKEMLPARSLPPFTSSGAPCPFPLHRSTPRYPC